MESSKNISIKDLTILLSCCELKYTGKTHCTWWANIKKTGIDLDVCCYLIKATWQTAKVHIWISVNVDEQYIWTYRHWPTTPFLWFKINLDNLACMSFVHVDYHICCKDQNLCIGFQTPITFMFFEAILYENNSFFLILCTLSCQDWARKYLLQYMLYL